MTHYFYLKRNEDGTLRPMTGLASASFTHDRLFHKYEIEKLIDIVEQFKDSDMHCDDIRVLCVKKMDDLSKGVLGT
jgi:hypothetical protein